MAIFRGHDDRDKPGVRSTKRSSRKRPIDLWPFIQGIGTTVLKFSIIAIVISLLYLLYGVFSGALNGDVNGWVPPRIVYAVQVFGEILLAASVLATLSLLLLTIEDLGYALLAGAYGLFLMLGMPFIVSSNVRNPYGPATMQLSFWATTAGKLVLVLVGLRIAYEIYDYITQAPLRHTTITDKEQRGASKVAKPPKQTWWMQHCWEMPFCHEFIREKCPAYRARKNCWKYGRGCMCDPQLIESLIRTKYMSNLRVTEGKSRIEGEYIRSDLEADTVTTSGERTITCANCPIYAEHQRQKFRVVNPIAIILLIIVLAASYKPLTMLYSTMIAAMAHIASTFSYGQALAPELWFQQLDTPTVRVFFFALVFLLALAYVLKFVEWAIFVKKW